MTELRLERVTFEYPGGVRALEAVDLTVAPGTSLALIGANGSGKTTLLRHLDGLLRPTAGRVLHDGADIRGRGVAALARDVALGFQHPDRQIFGRNVRDEVEFGPRRQGASDEEAFARAVAALAAVGLPDELGTHPGDLGESRRKLLTIASVLSMETPVVAIDEPTAGLDRAGTERIEAVLAGLHAAGRTTIVASHDMRFVAETAERIVVLAEGRVRLDGTPAQVFAEERWPVLRAAGLEPPAAAVTGAHLGLGSTPTEADIVTALVSAG